MSRTTTSRDRGLAAVAAAVVLASTAVTAAELKPETIAAWNAYVGATELRIDRELRPGSDAFLVLDFQPAKQAVEERRQLDAGKIVLESMRTREPNGRAIDVPSGTIEHWRGAVLVRGVSLDLVLEALRSGATLEGQPDVLAARVLERNGDSMRTWLKVRRESVVTVTYDTEHAVSLRRLSPERAVSRSISTRIVELENPGTARERARPEGHDRGYLWRLNSYWRYAARPDGVVVEVESLTLSRGVPFPFSSLVSPIVNRIARESLRHTLTGLRDRLQALAVQAR